MNYFQFVEMLLKVYTRAPLSAIIAEHQILPKIQTAIEDNAFSPVIARSEATWQSTLPSLKVVKNGAPFHKCAHWFLGMTGLFHVKT